MYSLKPRTEEQVTVDQPRTRRALHAVANVNVSDKSQDTNAAVHASATDEPPRRPRNYATNPNSSQLAEPEAAHATFATPAAGSAPGVPNGPTRRTLHATGAQAPRPLSTRTATQGIPTVAASGMPPGSEVPAESALRPAPTVRKGTSTSAASFFQHDHGAASFFQRTPNDTKLSLEPEAQSDASAAAFFQRNDSTQEAERPLTPAINEFFGQKRTTTSRTQERAQRNWTGALRISSIRLRGEEPATPTVAEPEPEDLTEAQADTPLDLREPSLTELMWLQDLRYHLRTLDEAALTIEQLSTAYNEYCSAWHEQPEAARWDESFTVASIGIAIGDILCESSGHCQWVASDTETGTVFGVRDTEQCSTFFPIDAVTRRWNARQLDWIPGFVRNAQAHTAQV